MCTKAPAVPWPLTTPQCTKLNHTKLKHTDSTLATLRHLLSLDL